MNNRRSNDNDKNKLLYDPNQREQRRLGAFSNVENEDYDEDVNEEENVRKEHQGELKEVVERLTKKYGESYRKEIETQVEEEHKKGKDAGTH